MFISFFDCDLGVLYANYYYGSTFVQKTSADLTSTNRPPMSALPMRARQVTATPSSPGCTEES